VRSQGKAKGLHVTLWALLSHSAGGSTGQREKNTEPWLLRENQNSSQGDKGLYFCVLGYRKWWVRGTGRQRRGSAASQEQFSVSVGLALRAIQSLKMALVVSG